MERLARRLSNDCAGSFRLGGGVGVRDHMALSGVLSTQLLIHQFIVYGKGTGTVEIKDELRSFVYESIMYGQNKTFLADDSSFLKSGVIDSTGMLELVSYIEDRFGFKVTDEEIVEANLGSINNLVRFIAKKTGRPDGDQSGSPDTSAGTWLT